MADFQLDDDEEAGNYETYGGSDTSYHPSAGTTPELPEQPSGSKFYTPPNGNTGISGYGPGGKPTPTPQYNTADPGDFIRSLLGTTSYGANSLKSLKGAFGEQGYNVWTDINGGARGIITDPHGQDWNVLDSSESMDWWNNQTGRNWNPRIEQRGGGGPSTAQAPGMNATLDDAIKRLVGLFDQLQNPAVTDAQRATMRTNLQEPIESQRAARQEGVLQRASNRGLGLGSGVIEQEAQGVDQGFDRLLGEGFRGLAMDEMDRNERRIPMAASLGQALAGIGQFQSGLDADLYKFNAQLPISQLLASASSMNSLDNQTIPQQQDMSGLIGLLMGLAGQGQNAYNQAGAQEGNFWNGLFGQLPGLLSLFTGGGGSYAGNAGDFNPDELDHA